MFLHRSSISTFGFRAFFTSEAASCLLEPSSSREKKGKQRFLLAGKSSKAKSYHSFSGSFRPAKSEAVFKLICNRFTWVPLQLLRLKHHLIGKNSTNEDHAYVNWDELGFEFMQTDYMYIMKCSQGEEFTHGELNRFENIELSPASGILNYGQGAFEGLKAYRKVDGGVLLFRPEENARRMQKSAERMCMPSPSIQQFLNAVKETVLANKRWIPPHGKGSLYVRSLLMGSGPILGIAPAPDYAFLTYVCPVVNYFRGVSLNLLIDREFHRATRGGTGDVKAITNYSPSLKPQIKAKSRGFSDILFLDSLTKKNLEEVSTCNIFLVKGNYISTPATQGTILAGITRKSIIDLALEFGYQVEERIIPVEELVDAEEVFCTGTAVVVVPVGSITYEGKRFEYKTGADTVSQKLKIALEGIQTGVIEDKMGWTVDID